MLFQHDYKRLSIPIVKFYLNTLSNCLRHVKNINRIKLISVHNL